MVVVVVVVDDMVEVVDMNCIHVMGVTHVGFKLQTLSLAITCSVLNQKLWF